MEPRSTRSKVEIHVHKPKTTNKWMMFPFLVLILVLITGFLLSAVKGSTLTSFVFSRAYILNALEKVVPPNLVIYYQGAVIRDAPIPFEDGKGGKYTTSANARIEYHFIGTRVEFIGTTGRVLGITDIYLDGKYIKSMDFYDDLYHRKQLIYDSGKLSDEAHIISLRATGKANPKSTGVVIGFDSFNYEFNNKMINVDSDDPKINYIHPNQAFYLQFVGRKFAHWIEFYIITLLLCWIILVSKWKRFVFYIVPMLTVLWAISDEFHQSFIANRKSSFFDVVLDNFGALCALLTVLIIKLFFWYLNKKKQSHYETG